MNITINGQELDSSTIDGKDLEEILGQIQEHHLPPDQIIGHVILNGDSYSEDMPHAALEVPREAIETLELTTLTPEEIAVHFIQNGDRLIEAQVEAIPKITEIFRLGDEAEANEHYLRFLESFHLLLNMLDQAIKTIGIPEEMILSGDQSVNDHLGKMSNIITQLLSVQEQTDWIYLADLLEYELLPALESMRALLPKLIQSGH